MTSASLLNDARIQKATKLLEENPCQKMSEVAHRFSLSKSRLSHLFKAEMGISMNNYLLGHRLEEGAQLLASTELPIKEITYRLGYHHSSSFVRAFKTRFALAPSRYRKSAGQKNIATSANR